MSDISNDPHSIDFFLTPSDVAALFQVESKTVTRWAKAGKLSAIKTLGGHRRYRQSEVLALLNSSRVTREQGVPMNGEIQKAVIFRQPVPNENAAGDTMSDEVMEFPKLPELPKEPGPIEEGTKILDGWVMVSVYFPSMHALDAGKIIINTFYFKDRKAAEKVKRQNLKNFQEEGLPGMVIIRIRRLNDGMDGLSLSD